MDLSMHHDEDSLVDHAAQAGLTSAARIYSTAYENSRQENEQSSRDMETERCDRLRCDLQLKSRCT